MGGSAVKNYALIVDVEKCSQCYNCVLSCKDEHFGFDFPPITEGCQELEQRWVDLKITERGKADKVFVTCHPEFCLHCNDPVCAKFDDAVYRREDGIVIIDPVKAKGKKKLLDSCPYGAISWNAEKDLPQKCTLCAHLLDAGEKEPRCVEACPTSCLTFGDLNDPESKAARLVSEHRELQEQDSVVRYFGEPGRVISGSVYLNEKEVCEGAQVKLIDKDRCVAQTQTNGFGDFRFKNAPEGELKVSIECSGKAPISYDVGEGLDCDREIVLA
jgi:Fe-S-cluster-containing dehydrogenase component